MGLKIILMCCLVFGYTATIFTTVYTVVVDQAWYMSLSWAFASLGSLWVLVQSADLFTKCYGTNNQQKHSDC